MSEAENAESDPAKSKEIRRPVRHGGRQHGDLYRRPYW